MRRGPALLTSPRDHHVCTHSSLKSETSDTKGRGDGQRRGLGILCAQPSARSKVGM